MLRYRVLFPRWAVGALLLAILPSCGGGGGGSRPSAPTLPVGTSSGTTPQVSPLLISTPAEAARFLSFATFGPNQTEIDALVGKSAAEWVRDELAKPATLYLPQVSALTPPNDIVGNNHFSDVVWKSFIENDDQLRTRMTFALSQIVVADTLLVGDIKPQRAAFYADAVTQNAFGNYRALIDDVTYTPLMAQFLTYFRNRKGDADTGRMPDENYAREIMQLFTIGLVELNLDGTTKTDTAGDAIETYTNDDVNGLARVFTGLSVVGDSFFSSDVVGAEYQPLQMFEDWHSELEKTFLGATIPAGTDGNSSIDIALDTLFEHPNVAPFISRQLIQRFTSANPPPAYVRRVATAFETGRYVSADDITFGTGERGDLTATIAAILLDDYVFGDTFREADTYGRVREPILNFVHLVRAFDTANIDPTNELWLKDTSEAARRLGQHPFQAPSVFNYYRPGYVPPGTEAGELGMTVPEFQLVNAGTATGYLNFMTWFVFDASPATIRNLTFTPDYTDEIALSDDPAALADHLSILLTGGRMDAETKNDIIETLAVYPLGTGDPNLDRERRAKVAVLMAINAPSFRVAQ